MRNKFIANRLEEVLLNGRWIANTNYKEQLMGIPDSKRFKKQAI